MTVSSDNYEVQIYTGNGSTTAFSTVWAFDVAADVVVTERVIATGAETILVNPTHYSVSGGSGSSGTVTAVSAPSSSVQWVISRATTKTQTVDYTANDPFPSETHESAVDKLTRIVQEAAYTADRALQFPTTDSTSLSAVLPSSVDRANKFLGFNSSGNPIASAGSADTVTVSTFMATVLDDPTAAAARTTLGAAGTGVTNTFTARQTWSKGADVASAASLTPGGDGNYFDVTGTTTITTIVVPAGMLFMLQFDGALTLTHHATDLILPGGANITTAAGDRLIAFAEGANQVRVLAYTVAASYPLTYATQAQQETGTNTLSAVSPGRQHFHPSAVKCEGMISWSGGTPSLDRSYNVTSLVDDGVGKVTVTIATDFSADNYSLVASAQTGNSASAPDGHWVTYSGHSAGSASFLIANNANPPVFADPATMSFMMTGDL